MDNVYETDPVKITDWRIVMKNRIAGHLIGEKAHIWAENYLFHQFSPGNLISIKWGQPQWPIFSEPDESK